MKLLKGKYLLVLIAVCGMAAASMGMLTNVSGVFFSPIAEEMDVGRGSVSMTLTISNVVFAIGGMVAARIVRSPNFKRLTIISAIIFAGCTVLLAICHSLFGLYLFNAIRGFAAGIVGIVTVTMIITNWYYTNTGLITSIAMGFSGISGAVFSPILSAIIEKAGWRMAYVVDGIIIFLMFVPAIVFPIAFRAEDMDLDLMGYTPDDGSAATATARVEAASEVKRNVLMIAFFFAFLVAVISAFPQHMPGVASSYGFAASVGSGMLSAALVANTGGKLLFGALSDKIGGKRTTIIYSTVFTIGAIMMLTVRISGMMIPAAVLFGAAYSLATMSVVMVCRDAFGVANYPKTYPKVSMIMSVMNALGTSIHGYIYDWSGAYNISLIICAVVGVLAILTTLTIYRKAAKL